MNLLILGVDGLCPDIAREKGFPKMPFERTLSIPKELYYNDNPHTLKIWPSMFAGRAVDVDLKQVFDTIFERDTLDYKIKKFLISVGVKKVLQKAKVDYRKIVKKTVGYQWKAYPSSFGIETVLDHYISISWNIPGLDPEYIVAFPSLEAIRPYLVREYRNWKNVSLGMAITPHRLNVAYTHIIDGLAHRKEPIDPFYLDIGMFVNKLKKLSDIEIMLVSDHGATRDGDHTDTAYLGCTCEIRASNILEVRRDIESLLNAPPRGRRGL